ncbi:hypothetical protein U9M48_038755 [Paspalum notatum var. saurae]|uniref:Uncharacterized protein n=1 Tax=Paspalum notatum var. saurae TaxID=547442 RepID=A0AAQ3UNU6_PASNO
MAVAGQPAAAALFSPIRSNPARPIQIQRPRAARPGSIPVSGRTFAKETLGFLRINPQSKFSRCRLSSALPACVLVDEVMADPTGSDCLPQPHLLHRHKSG